MILFPFAKKLQTQTVSTEKLQKNVGEIDTRVQFH